MIADKWVSGLLYSLVCLTVVCVSCKKESPTSPEDDNGENGSILSGKVANPLGDGLAGVSLFVREHGEAGTTTVTSDLEGGWSYDGELPVAVTPNEPGLSFDPPLYENINSSRDDANFKSSAFENTARQDDLLVGACYYPWYDTDRHWQEGYQGDPVLGEYDSKSLQVNEIHISQAARYGIDFFVTSWWGENSFEDQALKQGLMTAGNIDEIEFAILYETAMLGTNEEGKIDLSDPQVRQNLISDVEYLADTYFGHSQYLTINGKPVLYLYLTRIFTGAYADAIDELRETISDLGYELYLIGDQVYWQDPSTQPEIDLMKPFDGITAYNMHTSVEGIDDNFVQKVLDKYSDWAEVTDSVNVDFIPGVIPGFDDTQVRPEAEHPVIEKDPEQFRFFVEGSKLRLSSRNMVIITSWNEWHENTQIEPGLDYGTTYLKVVDQSLAGHP